MTENSTVSPTGKTKPTTQYMPALTGIRAIAAFMVCFHHYNPLPSFRDQGGWKGLAFGFFNEMHIGVSVFFVLSGFLICYRYYNSAVQINYKWFGRYMMNRVARIYPMYFIITLITFALIEWNPARYEVIPFYAGLPDKERILVFLLNLTLLKGFFNEYKFTGIAQGWSLSVEESFYLAAPFFMLAIKRTRWALALLPIATLAFMLGLVATLGRLDFHGLFGSIQFMLNFTFFGRCLEFFAGIALAVYIHRRGQVTSELPAHKGPWLTLVGSSFLTLMLVVLASITTGENAKNSFIGITLNNAVLPIIIVVFFYGLLTEQTWLRRLLSTELFDKLGRSSYIFYLIHTGVLNIVLRTYLVHNSLIQFVLLNIISVALYKFVEHPLHRWIKPRSN
jgi:peptidoglycan/LPS O-acetylase OafA/YrhL